MRSVRKILKREVPLWVVALLLAASMAATLTVTFLPSEKISIFSGQVQASDFVVDAVISKPLGRNIVVVLVKIRNADSVPHSANVTVQLLDANGDIIEIGGETMEQTLETGEVEGGGSIILMFRFEAANLVELYETYQIVIYQTG